VLRAALPTELEGVPVDVRPANPLQTMRHGDPARYAALTAGPRQEYEVPDFAGEIRFDTEGAATTPELLAAARPHKDKLDYERPEGVSLDTFQEDMELTLNINPDAGWHVLHDFLVNTPETW
jgi:hypothetical protein